MAKDSNLREKALLLIEKYITSENIKKHLIATEALMRELAKRFNEDEEIWGITGLIHDIDWDLTKNTPEKHSILGAEILEKEGFPEEIVNAVRVHNHIHNLEPKTLLEKALYSCEEMTGFIVAVALVMPNKSLDEVTVERIISKFKEPSFAKGVNRDIIKKCEEFLNISIEELAEICLNAMKKVRDQLGL